ncbi:MAG: biopolymer transporter ExbD [Pseudomonadota bacterium]
MKFPLESRDTRPREAIVPMINVAFLLLIFFLMTAVIATPPPVDLRLPSAVGPGAKTGRAALFVGADGGLAFQEATGRAALIAAARSGVALDLRVDATLPATELARVLAALREVGVTETRLVTVAQ